MNPSFKANWGRPLILISTVATLICLGVAIHSWQRGHHGLLRFWLPLLLPFTALPFMVCGYRIEPGKVMVRRLFWETGIPLAGLTSAEREPEIMKGCLRLCGNGGIFSFTGWYWSRTCGMFRLFATNTQDMVALKIGRKTIVISPDRPSEFIATLEERQPRHE
ncbi:PH domain-containing protein [Luteolibacter sp. SL250]|uniref:PH domain-containing protein n=1 Tax=Luteolibacter sp. SL250 TaxID=2995170 RepID=UPI00226E2076|nr:PH domain-containing protein [Luteolibacter sp. SL250]WAC18274.1 PH domain-containing protein [Luteolibacter sp. SL250]